MKSIEIISQHHSIGDNASRETQTISQILGAQKPGLFGGLSPGVLCFCRDSINTIMEFNRYVETADNLQTLETSKIQEFVTAELQRQNQIANETKMACEVQLQELQNTLEQVGSFFILIEKKLLFCCCVFVPIETAKGSGMLATNYTKKVREETIDQGSRLRE